jgi:hypothetical protein
MTVTFLKYYPSIRQKGLRKNTKTWIRMSGFRNESLTQNLANTKHEGQLFYRDVW